MSSLAENRSRARGRAAVRVSELSRESRSLSFLLGPQRFASFRFSSRFFSLPSGFQCMTAAAAAVVAVLSPLLSLLFCLGFAFDVQCVDDLFSVLCTFFSFSFSFSLLLCI